MDSILCFNSRSREGSDLISRREVVAPKVSIHAPVKGATGMYKGENVTREVSIHAPVKGATLP